MNTHSTSSPLTTNEIKSLSSLNTLKKLCSFFSFLHKIMHTQGFFSKVVLYLPPLSVMVGHLNLTFSSSIYVYLYVVCIGSFLCKYYVSSLASKNLRKAYK